MPESLKYVTLLSLLLPSRKLVAFRNESRLGMHVHPCMFPACVCQATWRPAPVSMDASPTHALSGVCTHKLVQAQVKKIACPKLCTEEPASPFSDPQDTCCQSTKSEGCMGHKTAGITAQHDLRSSEWSLNLAGCMWCSEKGSLLIVRQGCG